MKKYLPFISVIVAYLTLISVFVFLIDCHKLGGNALTGYEEEGAFYIVKQGDNIQISEVAWSKNRTLGVVMIVCIGALALLYFYYEIKTFPSCIYKRSGDILVNVVKEIEESGSLLSSCRTAGRIGMLNKFIGH